MVSPPVYVSSDGSGTGPQRRLSIQVCPCGPDYSLAVKGIQEGQGRQND
jgi:hypothetical protein